MEEREVYTKFLCLIWIELLFEHQICLFIYFKY